MARKHRQQVTFSSFTTSIDTKQTFVSEIETAYTREKMSASGTSWVTKHISFSSSDTSSNSSSFASYSNMPVQKRFVTVGQRKISI